MSCVDALVIGGGITGLTAAYRLVKAGNSVTLFEGGELGGLIRTKHEQGFTLECGPNVFMDKDDFRALVADLKLTEDVIYPTIEPYKQYVWHNKKMTLVPKGPMPLLSTPLLGFFDKLRVFSSIARKGRLRPEDGDESIATFAGRLLGRSGVRNLLDPALKGIFGGNVERLSARSIFPELWAHACKGGSAIDYMKGKTKPRTIVFRGGAQTLVSRIKGEVEKGADIVRAQVERLNYVKGSNNTEPLFDVQTSDGKIYAGRRVFVTTSPRATAQFLKSFSAPIAQKLSAVPYAPLVVVHMSVPRTAPIPADSFGVLFPAGTDSDLLGIMFNSVIFPHVAPSDKHLLTLCFGGADSPKICERSDEELTTFAKEALDSKLQIREGTVLSITRWESAIPQLEVGHFEVVEELSRLEQAFPGLSFIGVDKGGIGVPDRVRLVMSTRL